MSFYTKYLLRKYLCVHASTTIMLKYRGNTPLCTTRGGLKYHQWYTYPRLRTRLWCYRRLFMVCAWPQASGGATRPATTLLSPKQLCPSTIKVAKQMARFALSDHNGNKLAWQGQTNIIPYSIDISLESLRERPGNFQGPNESNASDDINLLHICILGPDWTLTTLETRPNLPRAICFSQ